jgi:hypothetical protein
MTLGPFYDDAPALRTAVHHAERFAAILRGTHAASDEGPAAAWLCGRAEEIEVYVALVTRGWCFEEISGEEAVAAITTYLDDLHAGLRAHFGVTVPDCCDDALAQAITREIPFAARRVSASSRGG